MTSIGSTSAAHMICKHPTLCDALCPSSILGDRMIGSKG
jgi:hypothetical protein